MCATWAISMCSIFVKLSVWVNCYTKSMVTATFHSLGIFTQQIVSFLSKLIFWMNEQINWIRMRHKLFITNVQKISFLAQRINFYSVSQFPRNFMKMGEILDCSLLQLFALPRNLRKDFGSIQRHSHIQRAQMVLCQCRDTHRNWNQHETKRNTINYGLNKTKTKTIVTCVRKWIRTI